MIRQTADAPAGVFCDAQQALQCERCPDAARLPALLGAAPCGAADDFCRPAEGLREALHPKPEPATGQLEAVCDTREVGGKRYYRVSDARARSGPI